MTQFVQVPVRIVNKESWARLSLYGERHEFCGEQIKLKKENFTFAGGHRVRLWVLKKNVHWKIPKGVSLDISEVNPARLSRRRQ